MFVSHPPSNGHPGQSGPPQSLPVSSPFSMLSLQVGPPPVDALRAIAFSPAVLVSSPTRGLHVETAVVLERQLELGLPAFELVTLAVGGGDEPIPAIATIYHRHSHADVILSKIFEGFLHDGKEFPRMRLASMYIDQFNDNDWGRGFATEAARSARCSSTHSRPGRC